MLTRAATIAVVSALALSACGGSSNPEPAPSPTTATRTGGRCGPRTIGYDLSERLCSGRYTTEHGFHPYVSATLPPPSDPDLDWYGGAFSDTDLQFREAPSACDGCEVAVVEVVVADGSAADVLRALRRLPNMERLEAERARVGSKRAIELAGELGNRTSHAFGGIEFGPGPLSGYLVRFGLQTSLVLLGGDQARQLREDAKRLIASLEVRG